MSIGSYTGPPPVTGKKTTTMIAGYCILLALYLSLTCATAVVSDANVYDFGAQGDGKTDDTAAFVKAILSLEPVGGTVYAPDGRYLISGALELPRGVSLVGTYRTVSIFYFFPVGGVDSFLYTFRCFQGLSPLIRIRRCLQMQQAKADLCLTEAPSCCPPEDVAPKPALLSSR